MTDGPRIGLALGGGGAKGLAHIVVLEAFDQAGIRPAAIAGTSIGAIIGAAYAAGYSARALRDHALKIFRDRTEVMTRLFRARTGAFSDIFSGAIGNLVQVDGEALLQEFWPPSMPERFVDLRLPLVAVSTDFYGRGEAAIDEGPLRPAVAASMAIPGLVKPVEIGRRLHVDGAACNPLPFDRLASACDVIIAVDVAGGPESADPARQPSAIETTLGAAQIMQLAILDAKLKSASGKVHVVRPKVAGFGALDFFAVKQILLAAEPVRREIKDLLAEATS